MKLALTPNSPFARKVRVFIRERGGATLVSEEVMQPLENPASLRAINPLGKVPVLTLPDASSLFESALIVEYLDGILPGPASIPPAGIPRWSTLRNQAIADGLMQAAVSMTFERARSDASPSAYWLERWRIAIEHAIEELDRQARKFPDYPDPGSIATACALAYLDFRHAALAWRNVAPDLASWFGEVATRPSMIDTAPEQAS
ncbi:glutathione S-transferase family protein [Sphingobium lactosutens]|uniref:glutathione S-transferase family protein n=1 Tax=Sphingobium lactosutens TaxID=522773 RepID=UPI0015C0F0A9